LAKEPGKSAEGSSLTADPLLRQYAYLFLQQVPSGPVLDLASGDCHNGISLAGRGREVICCDASHASLELARKSAKQAGVEIQTWHLDLEQSGFNPLPANYFAGIIVFRYLHRPLIPSIKKALKNEGILIYETYTIIQPKFGKPRNPDFLLKPGELRNWFGEWKVIHHFEGIEDNPKRAIAQIVCQKPLPQYSQSYASAQVLEADG
jgi:SAM-dependent methyltransferase